MCGNAEGIKRVQQLENIVGNIIIRKDDVVI